MKSKKTLYMLLPAVLVIWALIIYQVVDMLSGDEPTELAVKETHAVVTEPPATYELVLDYSDPFLGGHSVRKAAPAVKTKPTKPKPKPKKVDEPARPTLRYSGRIENRESNAERHLISVNGNPHIVSFGDETDGVALEKVYADSVKFKWNGQTIYVRR